MYPINISFKDDCYTVSPEVKFGGNFSFYLIDVKRNSVIGVYDSQDTALRVAGSRLMRRYPTASERIELAKYLHTVLS